MSAERQRTWSPMAVVTDKDGLAVHATHETRFLAAARLIEPAPHVRQHHDRRMDLESGEQ